MDFFDGNVYIDQTGRKSGENIYSSFSEALNRIKKIRESGNLTCIYINVVGDYYLENTVEINLDNVVIQSDNLLNGQKSRIIGGRKIVGWQKDSFCGVPCISTKVKVDKNVNSVSELFVNGERADKTRFPKGEEVLRAKKVDKEDDVGEFNEKHAEWVEIYPEDVDGIDMENATINYNHYWIDEHTPIKRYDKENGRVYFKYPSRFMITTKYEPEDTSAFRYYLSNVATSFGKENAYYFDMESEKIFYRPKNDEIDLETIETYYPTQKKLFVVEGTEKSVLKNVTIRNIEFMLTDSEYASEGSEDIEENAVLCASDGQSVCNGSGAIEFKYVQDSKIEKCEIHGVGIHAVKVNIGCKRLRVENNTLYDIGAGGVSIVGCEIEKGESKYTHGNIVRKNKITKCGRCISAGCGILVRHSFGNEISENEISYTCYSGISVGWTWGYGKSNTYGNCIRFNHIHHIGDGILSDLGGIYLLGPQMGTVVEYNRIHDVNAAHYGGWGIYTDEGSSYIRIENNVIFRTKNECVYQHYGKMNSVMNNILYSSNNLLRIAKTEDHISYIIKNNIMVTNGRAVYFMGEDENTTKPIPLFISDNNVIYDISGKEPIMIERHGIKYKAEDFKKKYGKDINSLIEKPEFEDMERDNFTVVSVEKIKDSGFVPINGFPAKEN